VRLKDEETFMSRSKSKPSLLKRLIYFILLVSGGGAGVGGWAFKDHPVVQAIWTAATSKPADENAAADLDKTLVSDVLGVLKPGAGADFRQAGVYRVTIDKVGLDPLLFKSGHTVDIQAKVSTRDSHGREAILWDSRTYGERLATVGKDDLTAGWPDRSFQVEWTPGEAISLEIYDRKTGLFIEPERFSLSSTDAAPSEFPLKTGDHSLAPAHKPQRPTDPRVNHIVLKSQRVGDPRQQPRDQEQVAERPIIIK
jgi:hypothetical protein